KSSVAAALVIAALLPLPATSAEDVDLYAIQQIRAEERAHSRVMDSVFYLTDVNGPRLTNTPNFFSAADWVVRQLTSFGVDARTENWRPFGRSWQVNKYYAAMVEPQYMSLIGFPLAWTGSTNGPTTAFVALAPILTDADMASYRGTLKGKVVLATPPTHVELANRQLFSRWTDSELQELDSFPESAPTVRPATRARLPAAWQNLSIRELRALQKRIREFFAAEQVAAIISSGYSGGDGTVFGTQSGTPDIGDPVPPPSIVITPEHYNRISRLLAHNVSVKLNLDIVTELLPEQDSINVIGEIRGRSKPQEVVMLGAHLDSWHGATGATDNAAGSAAAIEAIRLLKALNLKTDRTVRLALWGGEEQGLLGSKAYVKQHYADPETMKPLPEHSKFDVYFNLDNGSGRIRGIYLQGNDMCRPIFEQWLPAFKDMGLQTITIRDTGSTDHVSFDSVGLPAFQFVQDRLEYMTVTHHSNMDLYDHVSEDDLKQASTILAGFAYLAANRSQMFPRKPLPLPHPAPTIAPGEPDKAKPKETTDATDGASAIK
ncbi:MAG: M20/M25/M40 family metallo-hydrolase, partial [Acidobacteriaceae bacterium]|nr:M20/M25/M40 family metallo-hydrolase [Acidobacteriaceae bacterium]